MGYMDNYNSMSKKRKIDALENEICLEKYYLENTSNGMKLKHRRKYIKKLEDMLIDLTTIKN